MDVRGRGGGWSPQSPKMGEIPRMHLEFIYVFSCCERWSPQSPKMGQIQWLPLEHDYVHICRGSRSPRSPKVRGRKRMPLEYRHRRNFDAPRKHPGVCLTTSWVMASSLSFLSCEKRKRTKLSPTKTFYIFLNALRILQDACASEVPWTTMFDGPPEDF